MDFWQNSKRRDRGCVLGITLASSSVFFLFTLLTPMLSDDFTYGAEVKQAASVADLFRQEVQQYMGWSGRSVVHLLLRFFLYGPRPVFVVLNTAAFALLGFLLYGFVVKEKRWSPFLMLLVHLGLWIGTVDISQTMFWETGACNYLWGSLLILLFMTWMRRLAGEDGQEGELKAESGRTGSPVRSVLTAAGSLVLGVVAGWCNENTSGGALLYALWLLGLVYLKKRKGAAAGQFAPLLAGTVGCGLGLFVMVRAPGNAIRSSLQEEELHHGLAGLLARFEKISAYVRSYFFPLLVLILLTVAISIAAAYVKRRKGKGQGSNGFASGFLFSCIRRERIVFFLLFACTAYALLLTSTPQPRALFGAGLFLLISLLQGIADNLREEREVLGETEGLPVFAVLYGTAASALTLFLLFDFLEGGTNLYRIRRDVTERIAYIEERRDLGDEDVAAPMLHPDFETRYSAAYEVDLADSPGYWINFGYARYLGVDAVYGLPYDEWETFRDQLEAGEIHWED